MADSNECLNCYSIDLPTVDLSTATISINGAKLKLSKCYSFITDTNDVPNDCSKMCIKCQQQCKNVFIFKTKFGKTSTNICSKQQEQKDKLTHNIPFFCQICKTAILNQKDVIDHMKNFHLDYYMSSASHTTFLQAQNRSFEFNPSNNPFKCQYCGVIIHDQKDVITHVKNFHSNLISSIGDATEIFDSSNNKFKCQHCKLTIHNQADVITHVKEFHSDLLPPTIKSAPSDVTKIPLEMKIVESTSSQHKFKCQHCNVTIPNHMHSDVMAHVKAFHPDRLSPTVRCLYCFKHFAKIKEHVKSVHVEQFEEMIKNNDIGFWEWKCYSNLSKEFQMEKCDKCGRFYYLITKDCQHNCRMIDAEKSDWTKEAAEIKKRKVYCRRKK